MPRDFSKYRPKQLQQMRDLRAEWLHKNGPCRQCFSWDRLEVDHVDRTTKVGHKVWSWTPERRAAELAKCQVLCHDCHLKKTILERTPPHGSNGRYTSKKFRCRCNECRAGHAKVNAKYRPLAGQ